MLRQQPTTITAGIIHPHNPGQDEQHHLYHRLRGWDDESGFGEQLGDDRAIRDEGVYGSVDRRRGYFHDWPIRRWFLLLVFSRGEGCRVYQA